MQFVLVIYHGSETSVSEEEKKAAYPDYAALNNMENVTGCPPLGRPENATTVRVENGSAVTTQGPYLDVKSAVGGFWLSRPRTSMPRSPGRQRHAQRSVV